LWSVATSVLLRLASVLTTAVIAHILNRLDFGVFAIAMTVNGLVLAVGELGLGSCLVRADLDIDALAPTMVTVSVVTNTIQAAAMAAFAGPIGGALGSAKAADSIRILALGMFVGSIFSVPNCQLVRDFRQNRIFLAQAVAFVPSTAVLFVLASLGSGPTAFAWSMLASQLAYGCVVLASVKKLYLPRFARSALHILIRSGLPLGAANIVNYVLLNADYALLGHLMGAVALGTYVLAFNVASWPASLLGNMINNVSMPAFSRIKHDPDLLRNAAARALRSLSLVVLPVSALTMVLARPIILTLYGAKWEAAAAVLSLLTVYGAVSIICVLFANVLAGLGLSRFLLAVQLLWLAALVPAMIIGVHRGGIVGAAVAHIVVIAPGVLPCYLIVLKKTTGIRLTPLARAALPALLASAAAAAAAFGAASQLRVPLWQLAAGLSAGSLVYLMLTTPQAMQLLSRRQAGNPYVRRVLRAYRIAALMAGLPGVSQPRHAAPRGRLQPRVAALAPAAALPPGSVPPAAIMSAALTPAARPGPSPAAALPGPAMADAVTAVLPGPALADAVTAVLPRPVPAAIAPSPDEIRSAALALELLLSLSKPEPPVPPLAKEPGLAADYLTTTIDFGKPMNFSQISSPSGK
jgi:lipopolysaccharide exporter